MGRAGYAFPSSGSLSWTLSGSLSSPALTRKGTPAIKSMTKNQIKGPDFPGHSTVSHNFRMHPRSSRASRICWRWVAQSLGQAPFDDAQAKQGKTAARRWRLDSGRLTKEGVRARARRVWAVLAGSGRVCRKICGRERLMGMEGSSGFCRRFFCRQPGQLQVCGKEHERRAAAREIHSDTVSPTRPTLECGWHTNGDCPYYLQQHRGAPGSLEGLLEGLDPGIDGGI